MSLYGVWVRAGDPDRWLSDGDSGFHWAGTYEQAMEQCAAYTGMFPDTSYTVFPVDGNMKLRPRAAPMSSSECPRTQMSIPEPKVAVSDVAKHLLTRSRSWQVADVRLILHEDNYVTIDLTHCFDAHLYVAEIQALQLALGEILEALA